MANNILYIVEGETEEKLVKMFFLGRVIVSNLWDLTKIENITRMIKPSTIIYIVADTDTINAANVDRFVKNIYALRKSIHRPKVNLLLQNLNCEDELMKACRINSPLKKREFLNEFNVAGVNKFKNQLIKISNENLQSKLIKLNFNLDLLWCFFSVRENFIQNLPHVKLNCLDTFLITPTRLERNIL